MPQARWPGFDRKAELAWVRGVRKTMLADMVRAEKRALAERLVATRKLFRRKVLVGDIHSHTTYSDGVSTVAENKEMADLCGLDFLFITDHRTLAHKRHCNDATGPWWGQEPPTKVREIGVLMPRRLFVPVGDSAAADFRRAQAIAPFAWVPHPVGYGRGTYYPEKTVQELWHFGNRFAMEVLNGSQKLSRAYDAICAKAARVWDQLLCSGRQVTVLGASDAHICCTIGTAWTGVYADACTPTAVIDGMTRGRTFASEGPLLWLSGGRAAMGGVIRSKPGGKLRLRFVAADSAGLRTVRVVSGGKVIHDIKAGDKSRVAGEVEVSAAPGAYFRLECVAADRRRAFSSPIFVSATPR